MKVYVVESGEYENHSIDFVAATVEFAVAKLKATYAPPYVVRWHDLAIGKYGYSIRGDFERVLGYSTEHAAIFDINEYEVEGS